MDFLSKFYLHLFIDFFTDEDRNPHYLSHLVCAGMDRISFDKGFFPVFIPDRVDKLHARPLEIFQFSFDNDDLVISRWKKVIAIHLSQGQIITLFFHLCIDNARTSEQFCSPNFEPYNIIGMIYNAHGICISVYDTYINVISLQ